MSKRYFQTSKTEDGEHAVGTFTPMPLREKFNRVKERVADALSGAVLARGQGFPRAGRVIVEFPEIDVATDEALEALMDLRLSMDITVYVSSESEAEAVKADGQEVVRDAMRRHNGLKWSVMIHIEPTKDFMGQLSAKYAEQLRIEREEKEKREHANFLERIARKTKAWESPDK